MLALQPLKNKLETAEKNKTEQIIETAQKRFGIYGIEKTSMREIANDMKLSKASLYYYFPDKESLYKAVIFKEQKEFFNRVSEKIENIHAPEQVLIEYITARLEYFRTLLNLSRLRYEEYSEMRPVFRDLIDSFRTSEKEIIERIFKKGIREKRFIKMNTGKTATLFLDLIRGLRLSIVTDKKTLLLENDEYEKLLGKCLDFTRIFINGIKNNKTR